MQQRLMEAAGSSRQFRGARAGRWRAGAGDYEGHRADRLRCRSTRRSSTPMMWKPLQDLIVGVLADVSQQMTIMAQSHLRTACRWVGRPSGLPGF